MIPASELRTKIVTGEFDPNNASLFFGDAIKASILFLNKNITLRGKRVPHFILNTGDEIMYRELMDYQYTRNGQVTDENFVYNEVPRCIITANSISTQPDQLTQPYTRGYYEIEYDDNLYEMTAEVRRLPVTITLSLKYTLDSFTDSLALSQELFTNLSYIRTFNFEYLGEIIPCSIKFPDGTSIEAPSSLEFDTESRYKSIDVDLELETNLPIFNNRSTIESDAVISKVDNNIGRYGYAVTDDVYKKLDFSTKDIK